MSTWTPASFEIKMIAGSMKSVEGITSGYWGIHTIKSDKTVVLTYLGPVNSGQYIVEDSVPIGVLQNLADQLTNCLDTDGTIKFRDQMKRTLNAYDKNTRNRHS